MNNSIILPHKATGKIFPLFYVIQFLIILRNDTWKILNLNTTEELYEITIQTNEKQYTVIKTIT
ncbi:hypothetical protein J2772_004443 [Chryseobacterium jejuense]|nr:hypothetical protein [Chryseobacterium jejuense]